MNATALPTKGDADYVCHTHRAYGVHLNGDKPCKWGPRFRARISSFPIPGGRAWEYQTIDMKGHPDRRIIIMSGIRPTWTEALNAALEWIHAATAIARELRA